MSDSCPPAYLAGREPGLEATVLAGEEHSQEPVERLDLVACDEHPALQQPLRVATVGLRSGAGDRLAAVGAGESRGREHIAMVPGSR